MEEVGLTPWPQRKIGPKEHHLLVCDPTATPWPAVGAAVHSHENPGWTTIQCLHLHAGLRGMAEHIRGIRL